MRYLLLAVLLCGCQGKQPEPKMIDTLNQLVLKTAKDSVVFSTSIGNTFKNEGPHAIVLSDDSHCLLLRPGESGTWFGGADISTPDGYEKEDIK